MALSEHDPLAQQARAIFSAPDYSAAMDAASEQRGVDMHTFDGHPEAEYFGPDVERGHLGSLMAQHIQLTQPSFADPEHKQ